jgi:hypothetical protein
MRTFREYRSVLFSALALIGFCWLAWHNSADAENSVGPSNLLLCNKMAQLPAGSTGNTQVIPAVAGQQISICGWEITNTAANGTFAFSTGTGTNCGTGNSAVTPALNISNTAPSVDRQQYAGFGVPTGNAFCINPSVATIAAIVFYAQF